MKADRAQAEPSLPRQASLNRMRRFGVRPNRELGQNFLVDDNVLGVIERAAELDPADVVLEVGGGLGVLSEHLAPRVGHLHVVEIDRGLEPPLREALADLPNAQLHLADAVSLDLGGAAARAGQGGGQPALRRGGHRAPAHRGGAAGGRAVGGHGAARGGGAPGGRAGIQDLRGHLGARAAGMRGQAAAARVAHRLPSGRPTWTRPSCACAAAAPRPPSRWWRSCMPPSPIAARRWRARWRWPRTRREGIRDRAREALVELGHPADVRAERLAPQDFTALAALLADAWPALGSAPARR